MSTALATRAPDSEPRTVELPRGPLSYSDVGAGPVLVALHGVPGSRRDFRRLEASLAGRARLVRVDLPCFGATPLRTGPGVTEADAAGVVGEVLEALGLEKVVLVGHSRGAAVAAEVAASARSGNRVVGLALLSPLGLRPHRSMRWMKPGFLVRCFSQPLLDPLFSRVTRVGLRLGGMRVDDLDTVRHAVRSIAAISFPDYERNLKNVRVPALVAWADDDSHVQSKLSHALAAAAPAGPRLRHADGGHVVHHRHAAAIADSLVEFAGPLFADRPV